MWTREELTEIRERAEQEARVCGCNEQWRHACLGLAAAADRLDALTDRIERGLETAVSDESLSRAIPLPANVG
jgi:hypothetical protein